MNAFAKLLSFATAPFSGTARNAPPREGSAARKEAQAALVDEQTSAYRPGRPLGAFFDGSSDLPDFARMLADVPAMMATARVSHVMDVYKSGISGAEIELQDASSPEVGEYALSEAKRFWQRCLLDAQNSYDYGRGGAECVYTDEDGPLRISHLLPFAGPDARPLLRGNDYFGIRIQGAANVSDLWGAGALPAKGFWHAHNKKYNRHFGFPQPYPAWRAWRRLCCRNGAEEVTDGAIYRFGLAPFIGRFPVKDVPANPAWGTPGLNDGSVPVSTRDRMRQMMEELIAGAVLCLSSQQTKDGVYDWDIYPLERVLDVSGLTGYCDSLEKQISLGIGVPPEMIEAAEVGSGYSGRAIPLEAWTMRQQTLAWVMLESWWRQIGRPLLWWNYGPGAWARLGVADLLASRMKALAAAARGGDGAPGAEQAPGAEGQGGEPAQGTFQGKTGKWFRKNEQGRTVPAAEPGGQQFFATRRVGEVWKGPSGRWFTKNDEGHVVPHAAPGAEEGDAIQKKAAEEAANPRERMGLMDRIKHGLADLGFLAEPKAKGPSWKEVSKLSVSERMDNSPPRDEFVKGLRGQPHRAKQWEYVAAKHGKTVEETQKEVTEKLNKLIEPLRISYRVKKAATLEKILDSGQFKNQFHPGVHSEAAIDDNRLRASVEEPSMGVPPDTPPDERPIYGYLTYPDNEAAGVPRTLDAAQAYGDWIVNFKPEVKQRMSLSYGDSLMGGTGKSFVSCAPGEAVPECIDPGVLASRGVDILDDFTRFDQESRIYIEAHVYGRTDLSHVESIDFPKHSPPTESVRAKLKEHGIPWRVY